MRALSSDFLITLREPNFGNTSLSYMLNLIGVLSHIDCQWQVSWYGLRAFAPPPHPPPHPRLKWNYRWNQKYFMILLFHFWNLHHIFNIFREKMIVIANLLRKLQTVQDLVRALSKKHLFRGPFDSQHVKGSQTLAKSAWEHFHHIFPLLWEMLIWRISPLVIC